MFHKRNIWQHLFILFLFVFFAAASVQSLYAFASATQIMQDATAQTGTQLSGENLSCLSEAYSLEELVDCVSSYMPDKGSEGFVTPTLTVQNEWRTLVRDMLAITDISQCSTIDLPASLEDIYDVFHFTDAYNGRQYCVALEVKNEVGDPDTVDRGWGMLIVNPHPERYLSIDIPHPLEDARTNKQGIAVFKGVGAHTFLMAGANRYANSQESPCQSGEFLSDVAHCTDNLFFPAVVEIDRHHTAAGTSHTAIQFHGMTADGCPNVDIYITYGTAITPTIGDSILTLRQSLEAEREEWKVAVPGNANRFCDKHGTDNVEGRYLNHSRADESAACGGDAAGHTGKFISL